MLKFQQNQTKPEEIRIELLYLVYSRVDLQRAVAHSNRKTQSAVLVKKIQDYCLGAETLNENIYSELF